MPFGTEQLSLRFHEIGDEYLDFVKCFFPIEVLGDLAHHFNSAVRIKVAWCGYTPPETLALLAKDHDEIVRRVVASNIATPPDALAELASDPSERVREWVARNPSTPPWALERLAEDRSSWIRHYVASNPNTLPDTLRQLAMKGSVDYALATNPSTPVDILMAFAIGRDDAVRSAILRNPGAPEFIKCAALAYNLTPGGNQKELYEAMVNAYCDLIEKQEDIKSLQFLARYPKTPEPILKKIADRLLDKNSATRYDQYDILTTIRFIMENPNTKPKTAAIIRKRFASLYPNPPALTPAQA